MSDRDKERGLYQKYEVRRVDPEAEARHQGCEYFVLDLTHDPLALEAIKTYEEAARRAGYTKLADDLQLARHAAVLSGVGGTA